jgi:putative acyl-CoA dehydrogenase
VSTVRTSRDAFTHEVLNQAPPLSDYNLFDSDYHLVSTVKTWGRDLELTQRVFDHGAVLGSRELLHTGHLANAHPPVFRSHDLNGYRIDSVEFHPAYHTLMDHGVSSGATNLPWVLGPQREVKSACSSDSFHGAHIFRATLMAMQYQVDGGHTCPLVMTFAGLPVLRSHQHETPWLKTWVGKMTSGAYDPSNAPLDTKRGATLGMSMTEKQGGSDVRANTTLAYATEEEAGFAGRGYVLYGHKWFTSAPMCDGL